jgi:integrase
MAKLLTVKEIESKKPTDKPYKFAVDRGLYIRVPTNGIKTWLVRYVVEGIQIDYALPRPYGAVGDGFMSLAEAKALNANIQSLAREGINYQTQQADLKQAKADAAEKYKTEAATFNDLYLVWLRDGVSRSDGNKYISQSFSKHAIPTLGDIEVRKLTEHHLRNAYRTTIESGKVATAVELSKDIRQMLRWAEMRKPWRALLIDGNPSELVEIDKLLPTDYTKERKRLLSIDEIKKLKTAFDNSAQTYADAPIKYGTERPIKKEIQIAMWLCLSTLCRIGELLMTEWKHVNFKEKTWFIPAANTKGERGGKRDQLVYLSDFSLEQFKLLHQLSGKTLWAFPAKNNDGHVCIKSASKLIGDRQVQFKSRTKKLKFRVESNSLVLGDEEWTPHDLRRTGATMMQKLKVHRDVINLCQNHVIGTKVDRVYLLDEYADEKREAWQKLGDRIEAILSADNVVVGNFEAVA